MPEATFIHCISVPLLMSEPLIQVFPMRDQKPTYPGLSFVTFFNPDDAKVASQRKTVRVHAARYVSFKGRMGKSSPEKTRQRRPRRLKPIALLPGESILLEVDFSDNQTVSHSPRHRKSTLQVQAQKTLVQCSWSLLSLLGAGRVDPFKTYPVPWEPFLPELMDHCLYP